MMPYLSIFTLGGGIGFAAGVSAKKNGRLFIENRDGIGAHYSGAAVQRICLCPLGGHEGRCQCVYGPTTGLELCAVCHCEYRSDRCGVWIGISSRMISENSINFIFVRVSYFNL